MRTCACTCTCAIVRVYAPVRLFVIPVLQTSSFMLVKSISVAVCYRYVCNIITPRLHASSLKRHHYSDETATMLCEGSCYASIVAVKWLLCRCPCTCSCHANVCAVAICPGTVHVHVHVHVCQCTSTHSCTCSCYASFVAKVFQCCCYDSVVAML